jgi:Tfp pilus assembly protein FimT
MIEMLIVFVVMAAVVTISIRSVGDTLRRDRVSKTAAILSADVEQAFAMAARQRVPVRLTIDSANRTFTVGDRTNSALKYRTRSFSSGDLSLDFISTNNTVITDTLKLTLGIYSKGGATYTKAVRSSLAGLVRVDNR